MVVAAGAAPAEVDDELFPGELLGLDELGLGGGELVTGAELDRGALDVLGCAAADGERWSLDECDAELDAEWVAERCWTFAAGAVP